MRRFMPTAGVSVLVSVLLAGSSASFGPGPGIAAASTIDIVAPAAPDTAADQTVAGDGMDIWYNQPTGSVGPLGGVSVSGGFFCQDSDSPGSTVRLEITLVQNNDAHGYAEGLGVCQGNRTWTATVRPDPLTPLFVPNQTIEAHVTMAKDGNVGEHVSADALLIANVFILRVNPNATSNPGGIVTVTGTYTCGASYAPAIDLTITATVQRTDGTADTGAGLITLTCSATNQSWTATITPTAATRGPASTAQAARSWLDLTMHHVVLDSWADARTNSYFVFD